MPTIREWEKDLDKMSDIQLLEIKQAFDTLKKWPMFESEFGISLLHLAVKLAIDNLTRR